MERIYNAGDETFVLPSFEPADGGVLPVNAFVVRGKEPVVVDTGMAKDREQFMEGVFSIVEPQEIKWIILTHDDNDHTGNLRALLDAAPNARLVTNFLSWARMGDNWQPPLGRIHAINPGQSFDAGDRSFTALRPPTYDSPSTVAFFDSKSRTLFGSDSFGAFIPELVQDAGDMDEAAFIEGFQVFNRALSPWTALVAQEKFDATIRQVERLQPQTIVSGHGVVMRGRTERMLRAFAEIPSLDPYVTPDQQAVEMILKSFETMEAA